MLPVNIMQLQTTLQEITEQWEGGSKATWKRPHPQKSTAAMLAHRDRHYVKCLLL